MKLILQDDRIAAVAESYNGPMDSMDAPEGFDVQRLSEYRVVDGAVTIPAPPLQEAIVSATQQRLDDFAKTRNYDDIKSAVTYAGCSVPKFATEGEYCRDKRAETWAALYQVLAEVQAGTRPVPTGYADVEPLLPVLEWPA